jgi:MFS family permease
MAQGMQADVAQRVRRLGYGLSAELWIVQAGVFLNYLGWGAVMPFEVIYLHDGRGFSLGTAGLVVGMVTGLAIVVAPVTGAIIDHVGARVTALAGGLALAAGYAGLALAHRPSQALAAGLAAGVGNGALLPSQSTLVAALVGSSLRHRGTAVSRVAANLGVAAGGALGGIVASHGLHGLVVLFMANAVSYLMYVGILATAVKNPARPARPKKGGYRLLARDRAFVRLAILNVAVIGVGWGFFTWVLPPFVHQQVGAGTRAIGLLLSANALTVVAAQIPVAKLAEGRRRAATMALAAFTFAAACGLVLSAAFVHLRLAYAVLIAAEIAVGVGECLYTTALMPLVADLAPVALRGRYMGAIGLSWWLGLALAPTGGTWLLGVSPQTTVLAAGAVSLAAGAFALAIERDIPAAIRLTPQTTERPSPSPDIARGHRA